MAPGFSNRVRCLKSRVLRAVFGDRVGVAIFLGALVFFGLYWRIGFFINDNWTIANTLVAVADGHLYIDRIVYGPESVSAPGLHIADGRLYGRNYGHVFLSLPFLWALQILSFLVDPRVLIAGGWSLLLLGFVLQVGWIVGQPREFALLGGTAAVVLFIGNVASATPLDPHWFPVMALQLSSMVAAAFIGVVLYRLLTLVHDRTTGAFVGGFVVLATPIAFWASIPKRHVLTALLATVALYGFAVSRDTETERGVVGHRSMAYAAVGITAWVHAAEALVLFAVLLPVDLWTARSNDRRTLAAVGSVFVVSLFPFLLTNLAIAGNPLDAPRMIASYDGDPQLVFNGTPNGDATGGRSFVSSGTVGSIPFLNYLPGFLASLPIPARSIFAPVIWFGSSLVDGALVFVTAPSDVYRVFFRSGWLVAAQWHHEPAINLTLLESTPIFAVIFGIPFVISRRIYNGEVSFPRVWETETDLLVLVYVLTFSTFYITRLPLYAQVTVRYLVPVVPMLGYALGRSSVLRRVVVEETRFFVWTVVGVVLIGGQLAFLALRSLGLTIGEAMQLHAVVALFVVVGVVLWLALDVCWRTVDGRIGAVVLAFAAALSVGFVLATGSEYFPYGNFALGLSRVVSDAVDIVY